RVFYADNGSAAIEVALKMSFHCHRNRGDERRTRFIALSNSYHGETLGALSMGDIPLYRRVYAPLLLEPLFAPSPDAFEAAPGRAAAGDLRGQRRHDQRPDPGAAGAVRRWHAHASSGLPAAGAGDL